MLYFKLLTMQVFVLLWLLWGASAVEAEFLEAHTRQIKTGLSYHVWACSHIIPILRTTVQVETCKSIGMLCFLSH